MTLLNGAADLVLSILGQVVKAFEDAEVAIYEVPNVADDDRRDTSPWSCQLICVRDIVVELSHTSGGRSSFDCR